MAFWWRVSSESDFDFLHFVLDGQTNASLSGQTEWARLVLPLPEGTHTLRWVYSKDEASAAGLDAAWLDEVVFIPDSAPPGVVTAPASRIVAAGECVTLSLIATGAPPLRYQWLFNDTPLDGQFGSELALCPALPSHAGLYSVAVGNPAGWVTSAPPAVLTVVLPPAITLQPASQIVATGSSPSLTVEVSGTPPFEFQWQLNGATLVPDDHRRVTHDACASRVDFNSIQTRDAGVYTVVMTCSAGAVTSAPALLSVLFPPVITNSPAGKTSALGGNVKFTVQASGSEPLLYQWFHNGQPLANDSRVGGASTNSLTLRGTQPADAGPYTVRITNAVGSASAQTILLLQAPPWIAVQPMSQTALLGSSVALHTVAYSPEPLTHRWQFNTGACCSLWLRGLTMPRRCGRFAPRWDRRNPRRSQGRAPRRPGPGTTGRRPRR